VNIVDGPGGGVNIVDGPGGGVNVVDGPGGGVNIVDGPGGGVNIVDDAVNMRTWPCCDQCGVCNRRNPPECQCMDIMFQGCHPRCRNCIKYVSSREPPVYRCGDNLTNFCRRRCSPTGPI
jgi:hypothetical protein